MLNFRSCPNVFQQNLYWKFNRDHDFEGNLLMTIIWERKLILTGFSSDFILHLQLGDSQEAEEEVGIGTDPRKNIPQSPQHVQQLVGIKNNFKKWW